VGGGAVGDGEQFLDGGLAMAALKAFVTLAQDINWTDRARAPRRREPRWEHKRSRGSQPHRQSPRSGRCRRPGLKAIREAPKKRWAAYGKAQKAAA
jgi:hypothetical protein